MTKVDLSTEIHNDNVKLFNLQFIMITLSYLIKKPKWSKADMKIYLQLHYSQITYSVIYN